MLLLALTSRSEDLLVQIFYCTVARFRFGLTTTEFYQRPFSLGGDNKK